MHAAHLEAFPCLVSRCETEPLWVLSQFHRLFLTCIFMCIIDVLAREDAYLYWLHLIYYCKHLSCFVHCAVRNVQFVSVVARRDTRSTHMRAPCSEYNTR